MADTSEPSLTFGSFNQEDLMETEMSAVVVLPPSEGSVLVDFGSWTHEESLFYQQAHCADLELFTVEYVAAVRDEPPTPVPVPAPAAPRPAEAPKPPEEEAPAKAAPVHTAPASVPVVAEPVTEPAPPQIAAPPSPRQAPQSPKPVGGEKAQVQKQDAPVAMVASTPSPATTPKAPVESVVVEAVEQQKAAPTAAAEQAGPSPVGQAGAGAQHTQAGPAAHAPGHHAYPMARHAPTEQQPQANGHATHDKQPVGEVQIEKAKASEVVHSEPPKSPKPGRGKEKKDAATEHPKPAPHDTHKSKEHAEGKPKPTPKQPAVAEAPPQPPHSTKQPETPVAATAAAPEQTQPTLVIEPKAARDGQAAPTHPKASKPEEHKPPAHAPAKPSAHPADRQGAQAPRPAHGRPQGHVHGAHAHTQAPTKGAEPSGLVAAGGEAQAHGKDEHRAKGAWGQPKEAPKKDGPVRPPAAPAAGAQPPGPAGPKPKPQGQGTAQELKPAWGKAAAVAPAPIQPQSAWGKPAAAPPAKPTPEPPAPKEEPAPTTSTPQPSQPAPTASPVWGAAVRSPAQASVAPRQRTGPTPRPPPPSTGAPRPSPPPSSTPAPRPAATPSSPVPQADSGAGRGVATPPPQSPQPGNAWRSGSPSIMSSPAPVKASPAPARAPQPAAASPSPTPTPTLAASQAKTPWASLFPANNTAATRSVGGQGADRRTGGVGGSKYESMAELLRDYKAEEHFGAVAYEPRGLVNTGNMCYIHSILQTMVGCRPMAGLLKELRQMQALPRLGAEPESRVTPVLDCMMQFFGELKSADTKETEVTYGKAFKPEEVYKMVESEWRNGTILGRQEDAQEFLTFLLDQLHEECLKLIKPLQKPNGEVKPHYDEEDPTEWEEVGPKQKTSIARHNQMDTSPISTIFSTRMRSMLRIQNQKSSTTYQPYNSLPLDIQSSEVRDVTHALAHLFDKEVVDGFKCSKTKQELQASKQSALEDLPPILILHLKRFIYDTQRSTTLKSHKAVTYPMNLEISKDLLSSTAQGRIPQEGRTYKLFAVVYHHGKDTNGGHYTCDVQMPGKDTWLRYDDTDVTEVQASDVTKPVMGRDAYLLFYQRADLCKGQ